LIDTKIVSPPISWPYTPLTADRLEKGVPLAGTGPQQSFIAEHIGSFSDFLPISADESWRRERTASIGQRLRFLLMEAGFPAGCPGSGAIVLRAILRKLGPTAHLAANDCSDWSKLLDAKLHQRVESISPIHTLMICHLLEIPLKRLFEPAFAAAAYRHRLDGCVNPDREITGRRQQAFKQLTGEDWTNARPTMCEICAKLCCEFRL
jgi:hypothetical protein